MNSENAVPTGCPFCGTGCGLSVEARDGAYKVKGDKHNSSTRGALCFKPIQMAKGIDTNRLDTPLYRKYKSDPFEPIGWNEAISLLSEQIRTLPRESLYFYLSGQLMSEESYLFTKLIKGHLGTNNVDANSRLCMASAVTAHKMAFGSDGPIGSYADIDDADIILVSGSNPAWAHPVVFRRILERKKAHPGTLIVTIDPVWTETAQKSDLWIGLNSGSDTTLYNALLAELYRCGGCDMDFIDRATEGFERTLRAASSIPFAKAIASCGIALDDAQTLVKAFASPKKIVGLWCQGLNQAYDGVMRNLGFINLFLATGRIGKTKGLPFSLTGQPNAMGGRECGYLSSSLPGYRDVRNPQDRKECEAHWELAERTISPDPGMTITDAVNAVSEGKIRLMWIVCTNPLLTLPDTNKTRSAFEDERLFTVVQDCVMSDSAQRANLVLPTLTWGEKEGTMTNSERFIKRFQPFKEPQKGALSDLEIVLRVGRALGLDGFEPCNASEVFDEYKLLTRNRLCDHSTQEFATLPYQWGGTHLYPKERFATPSSKAQFHPIVSSHPPTQADRWTLVTGRTKKQWHTMTRTGNVEELLRGEEEAYVLMNSDEAQTMGIAEGESVCLSNALGSLHLPVRFGRLAPFHLYAPFGYAQTPINALVPVRNDPFSFQSALKSARVVISKRLAPSS